MGLKSIPSVSQEPGCGALHNPTSSDEEAAYAKAVLMPPAQKKRKIEAGLGQGDAARGSGDVAHYRTSASLGSAGSFESEVGSPCSFESEVGSP